MILAADHDVLLGFSTKSFGAEEIFRVPEEGPVFYLGLRSGFPVKFSVWKTKRLLAALVLLQEHTSQADRWLGQAQAYG